MPCELLLVHLQRPERRRCHRNRPSPGGGDPVDFGVKPVRLRYFPQPLRDRPRTVRVYHRSETNGSVTVHHGDWGFLHERALLRDALTLDLLIYLELLCSQHRCHSSYLLPTEVFDLG